MAASTVAVEGAILSAPAGLPPCHSPDERVRPGQAVRTVAGDGADTVAAARPCVGETGKGCYIDLAEARVVAQGVDRPRR